MDSLVSHLVSWIVLTPFIGMVIIGFLRHAEVIRWATLATTLLVLGLTLGLWAGFDHTATGMQFVDRVALGIFSFQYAVGVDGISLPLILLTAFLIPLCVLGSWTGIKENVKAFMLLILLVEGAVAGVFTALDTFLFFLFWEITMIPMYFMIALWGGPNRIQAAVKFLLFSVAGSLLLNLGIEALHHEGGNTYDVVALTQVEFSPEVQFWIFLALFVGFAIKVPMLLVHGWIADAHGEAPTAGSVILSGLLLKMGTYGFLRFCLPIFPETSVAFAPFIQWLSVLAILYGGAMALAQHDFKRLIAYSSIAHMGFVTLGIFGFNNQSVQGAVLQMVNHGITTGALFLVVGMLYDRTHDRTIDNYGGLHQVMPRFVVILSIFVVAAFGLPGTGNFIGEFLVLAGTLSHSYLMVLLVLAGIVLGAAYMLGMFQRMALGPVSPQNATLPDLTRREVATVIPLILAVFAVGLYPTFMLDVMHMSVTTLLQDLPQIPTLQIAEVLTTP